MFGLIEEVPVARGPVRDLTSRSKFFSLAPYGLTNAQWTELMDLLRMEQGWTDTQLGKRIGISISMIRQCRIQMRPLPPAAKVRILAAMGVEVTLSNLIAALPTAVKEAVVAADSQSSFVRRTLIYGFFDRLDAGEAAEVVAGFIDGLAEIAGVELAGLAERLGLPLNELTDLREGRRPIPFLVKMAITESFTAHDMGPLILSLLPTP
jgi:transcriptional regulator with XRE-family HTH domain